MITDQERTNQAKVARQTEKAATRAVRFDGGTKALPAYANPDRRTAFKFLFGSWLALGSVALVCRMQRTRPRSPGSSGTNSLPVKLLIC